MSLETLLEAAKYLEYRSEAKARGEEPEDYPVFSRVNNHHHPSSSGLSNKHTVCCSPDLNRFDIIFDEVRDKRRVGGAGTREVHNKLEKNRRAHLKECFEMLKKQLPSMDDRKTSNLSILRGALRYIQTLKRKEREYEHEMEKLAREKIASQQKLASLKKELSSHMDHVDIANFLPEQDNETTTTASECGAYSDEEEMATNKKQISLAPQPASPETASQSSSSSNSNSEGPSMLDTIAMAAATLAHSTAVTPSAEPKSMHLSVIAVTSASVASNNLPLISTTPITVTNTASTVNIVNPLSSPSSTSSTGGNSMVTSSLPQVVGASPSSIKVHPSAPSKTVSFANASASHIQISTPVGATNSLQLGRMAGVLATPHSVQVINQANGGLKVLSSASATLNGPLHILSPAASSLMAMASASTLQPPTGGTVVKQNQALVHVATPAGKNGPSGVTLVASPAVVSMTQMKNASTGKQVILQQAPIGSRANSSKGSSSTTLALVPSANGATQVNGIAYGATTTKGTILATQKSLHHSLVGGTPVTQSATTSVSSRQLMASTLKSGQLRTSLSQFSGVAQIVSQPQIMSVNNHMGSLVAPVSVVSNTSSMIRASTSFGKVLTGTPLLKNVNSLPVGAGLLPQPTTILQTSNSVVKPMVVVSMAGSSTPSVVNIPISQ